ncbi:hypothetical protein Bpfe_001286 [Biomphalaria pfeifferi]|uniref:Uncharacterized protein n=1 Tax=Biomphalaria pfeifferi TaxID=112525 RepID=A0AAD8CA53_BIOPF|nr:hypothetical protein Bpfe_001286 [Biomphalaria pfeifferi]
MKSFSALLCCIVLVYPCKASVLGVLDLNNIKDTVGKTVEGVPVVGGIASGALNTAGGLTGVAGKRGEFPFLGGPGKRDVPDEEPVLGGLASGIVTFEVAPLEF